MKLSDSFKNRFRNKPEAGRLAVADAVLRTRTSRIAVDKRVSAFDCNKNGLVDFSDVVWLFYNL